jgi:cellulose synthase (UDP-forming)
VLPLATISITEDMATSMRLHALGWRSVYHHETLAIGLAPEDLGSSLKQRLRWAQGTLQVMFRENPLTQRGLALMQRLMYFATMWSYLYGVFALAYLLAPIAYLYFGWVPLRAYSADFFWHLLPYLAVNELLFLVVAWGLPTRRGRQYSLALFPLWITALTSVIGNVYFGRPLGFVVTPKTRQAGASLRLVRGQLAVMALLAGGVVYGLARLALGVADDPFALLVNIFWAGYDLLLLGVVLVAARYDAGATAGEPAGATAPATAAEAHGRP